MGRYFLFFLNLCNATLKNLSILTEDENFESTILEIYGDSFDNYGVHTIYNDTGDFYEFTATAKDGKKCYISYDIRKNISIQCFNADNIVFQKILDLNEPRHATSKVGGKFDNITFLYPAECTVENIGDNGFHGSVTDGINVNQVFSVSCNDVTFTSAEDFIAYETGLQGCEKPPITKTHNGITFYGIDCYFDATDSHSFIYTFTDKYGKNYIMTFSDSNVADEILESIEIK